MLNKNAGHGLSCSLRTAGEMLTKGKTDAQRPQQQRQEVEKHNKLYQPLKSNIQVGKDTGNVSHKGTEEKQLKH